MTSEDFCRLLREDARDFFTGVPDSTFKGVFACLERSPVEYVPAPREDLAVGLAVGAWLGGRSPVVLMQNSGLGTSMNALLSLAVLYRVPLLLLMGWRGWQGRDAPEHVQTGLTMLEVLRAIELPHVVVEVESAERDVRRAMAETRQRESPVVVLLREGVVR